MTRKSPGVLFVGITPPSSWADKTCLQLATPREALSAQIPPGMVVIARCSTDPAVELLASHCRDDAALFVLVAGDATLPRRLPRADYVVPESGLGEVLPSLLQVATGYRREVSLPEQHLDLLSVERRALRQALAATDGNRAAAARVLEIPRRDLYRLMKRVGLA